MISINQTELNFIIIMPLHVLNSEINDYTFKHINSQTHSMILCQ